MRSAVVMFCATLFFVSGGCASGDRDTAPPRPAPPAVAAGGATSATLTVHGLACPLCAHNIDKQLLRVAGVQNVDVDLGTGRVKVRFVQGRPPSDKELTAAVEAGGFTLNKIERP